MAEDREAALQAAEIAQTGGSPPPTPVTTTPPGVVLNLPESSE